MDLGALKNNCQLQVEWSGRGDILGNDCMHVSNMGVTFMWEECRIHLLYKVISLLEQSFRCYEYYV